MSARRRKDLARAIRRAEKDTLLQRGFGVLVRGQVLALLRMEHPDHIPSLVAIETKRTRLAGCGETLVIRARN